MGFFDKSKDEYNVRLDNSNNTYTLNKNTYIKLVTEVNELKSTLTNEITKNDLLITELNAYKEKMEKLINEIVNLKIENKELKGSVIDDK